MFEEIRPRTPEEHAIGDRVYRAWARRLMRAREFVGFLAVTPAGRVVAGGGGWVPPGEAPPRAARPPRALPALDVHGARLPGSGDCDADRPGGGAVGAGAGVPADDPPCVAVRPADVPRARV